MEKWLDNKDKAILKEVEESHYKKHWQHVLMKICRYRKALVANAHKLTQASLQKDPN